MPGSGRNAIWTMDGLTRTANNLITTVADLRWRLVAADDFDGDGKADLLWRNVGTGGNALWMMDGMTRTNSVTTLPAIADLGWKVAGVGDYDGDGKADILWRHASRGTNALWRMDGGGAAGLVQPADGGRPALGHRRAARRGAIALRRQTKSSDGNAAACRPGTARGRRPGRCRRSTGCAGPGRARRPSPATARSHASRRHGARSSQSASPVRRYSTRKAWPLPAVPWHRPCPLASGPACQVASPAPTSSASSAGEAPTGRSTSALTTPGAP